MSRILMGTGHRHIDNPGAARSAARHLIVELHPDAVRSGGAPGWDTLLAEAALDAGVPLLLDLPNQHYREMYPGAVSHLIVAQAAEVRYIVARPVVRDWGRRWFSERWWLDNHTRNHAMVDDSTHAVVGSPWHPLELAKHKTGGTAECVRYLLNHPAMDGVFWIPVGGPEPVHRWVPIPRQPDLFEVSP